VPRYYRVTLPMPEGVRLVRWQPKPPPVQLSQCSTVIDAEKFARTTLRQLDACLHGETWRSGNWELQGLIDRLAAVGCEVELNDPKRAQQ
jgi:hypothetical protein